MKEVKKRDLQLVIVTTTIKAPKGYRPRNTVCSFAVVTEKGRKETEAYIKTLCEKFIENTRQTNGGVPFTYRYSVEWVKGLLGISWLGAEDTPPDSHTD